MEETGGPRYLAIVSAVKRALATGLLRPGDRLPPQRDLANWLSLNIGTISRAYAEMHDQGLTRGEVGRGTFLSVKEEADGPTSLWDHTPRQSFVDLSHNFPSGAAPHPALSLLQQAMGSELDAAAFLSAQIDAGLEEHRRTFAHWLGRFGIEARADDMLVTCGGQHGLLLSLAALSRPGDVILTEELSFYGLKSAAALLGRSLVGVRMDREGIVPESLDMACQRTGARVLFCTPTLHNPTTATMSERRRREIVAVCERHDVTVIEDDVYGFMPDPPPRPLASMAPDRVVHLTSLSKLAGPGLRIGFMRVPGHLFHAFGIALRATTLMASPFNAEWAARILRSPRLDTIIAALRAETAARQNLVMETLPRALVTNAPGAFYFGLRTPADWTAQTFTSAAEARGVGITPYTLFEVSSLHQSNMVRVCVNAAPDQETLKAALVKLAELLDESAPTSPLILS
ncbi:MAG: PLP-dependent aminotransferase family protein [Magnetospirillum sp.]